MAAKRRPPTGLILALRASVIRHLACRFDAAHRQMSARASTAAAHRAYPCTSYKCDTASRPSARCPPTVKCPLVQARRPLDGLIAQKKI